MTQFLQHLFIASLWIYGIRTLFSHDHLLYGGYVWAEKNLPQWIIKPTIGCVMCQASLHGGVWFFLFLHPCYEWYFFVIFCVCLCGLNSILDRLTS